MPGICREVIEHNLGIDTSYKPIKQKKKIHPERRETIWQEVNKLLKAEFIRPVDYPSRLAKPIHVENPDVSWRMCINKACPKDKYLMPRI
jgi:hypothetical protein